MTNPKVNSKGQQELDKAQANFNEFDASIKSMTLDRMNAEAKPDTTEAKGMLSDRQAQNSTDIYLKPSKSIGCRDKFNEKFRTEYDFAKEYVKFIAYNKEITGETIDIWTRPYGGMPAEYWNVPANKPVWGPRYLAEQINRAKYNRLIMTDTATNNDGRGTYYGTLAVDTQVNRLEAHPVSSKKSVFMGASNF